MSSYFLLLSPRFFSLRNRLRRGEEGSAGRLAVMALVAIGFWVGIFVGFYKVLAYFYAAEGFGQVLAHKLMGMVWLTFFAVLLFSNVITALSTYFLSKDLEAIHASPAPRETIFWARLTDTMVDSSWMLLFFGLPVFVAFGIVFKTGPVYYLQLAAVSAPLLFLATSLGVIFTLLLVNVFPAQRTKDILLLLSIMLIVVLYLIFRFTRPERLVDPDSFTSVVSYFASLNTPTSIFLPSHWATEILWPQLAPGSFSEAGFYLLMLWSSAGAAAVIASWVSARVYWYGFSKSREAARRTITRLHPVELLAGLAGLPFSPASRVIISKEIRTFFRDNTQWSQLFLLMALIVVYLYNFSVLPLRRSPIPTFYLQNTISFLNIGLASFVAASLGVRFVFPAVSQEGFAYWIIRSSPLTLKRFLWTKFFIYAPPLIVVAEILIVVSNYLLNVTTFMMWISTVTIFFVTLGLVGLGVGLGAVYPRFETENLAQVATGFGGLIFMILSAIYIALIVLLEAFPVYQIFMAQTRGRPLTEWKLAVIGLCFLSVILINLLALFVPMKLGHLRLTQREAG